MPLGRQIAAQNSAVMAGLDPAIHASPRGRKDVDARDNPGHDDRARGASAPSQPLYRPVFTFVQSRLMTRWVAGSRAVMTNSFASVASSG